MTIQEIREQSKVVSELRFYIKKYNISYRSLAAFLGKSVGEITRLFEPGYLPEFSECIDVMRLIQDIKEIEREMYQDRLKALLQGGNHGYGKTD